MVTAMGTPHDSDSHRDPTPHPRPDVVIIMTDEERAAPPYESNDVRRWRAEILTGRAWFDAHAVNFRRHYTGSLACVPSRPTIFTGQYPDVHGVTQTDGLGKMADDSRLRWLREGEVPTLGHWFRAAGYDTHYDGKWHISHADLMGDDGEPLATNDSEGVIVDAAVGAYRAADPLDPFGFSGWIGPEPHGGALGNSGFRRDPLIADRVVAWLEDRYARRRAGEAAARQPFLLVASFVNPHDIVLFPLWANRGSPLESPSPLDPPFIPASPTDDEDLSTKPLAQRAYRAAYPTAYGPAAFVAPVYANNAQQYRDLSYRLHAEVDAPIDRVRRAVTDGGSDDAVIVRTSDHGELLGAHGGLHQKWFTLYDEATRVPFSIARIGTSATTGRTIDDAPTSHVDIVPTLLAAAGIDEAAVAVTLRTTFSEVHPLPGVDLMPIVDGAAAPRDRAVYLMTRDNILEGDSGASGIARRVGRVAKPPVQLRIHVPADVGSNFEGVVARVGDIDSGAGHLWKLVRTFDDPATWTEPGVRHLSSSGVGGETYRTSALPDQWELYDLDDDPIEAHNRFDDPAAPLVFTHMQVVMRRERLARVHHRNNPWPYSTRNASAGPPVVRPSAAARVLRRGAQKLGLHPTDPDRVELDLFGRRAVIVATNHAQLEVGKPTGVFARELTAPYYAFIDAGMNVDIASPTGGLVPVDPTSLKALIRSVDDDRFLADDELRTALVNSAAIGDLDMAGYDIVFLAGGRGAAFDFGDSAPLAEQLTAANALGKVIGGVGHGPLGLCNAIGADGGPLVRGRRITAVTDKQVRELRTSATPRHPETELRAQGARFESASAIRDVLANHWVVDGNLVTGQNQNAAPMVARKMMHLLLAPPPR